MDINQSTDAPEPPQWLAGLNAARRGYRLLRAHPSLWPFVWRALLGNLAVSTAVLILWVLGWWQGIQWIVSSLGTTGIAESMPLVRTLLLLVLAIAWAVAAGLLALVAWRLAQGLLLPLLYGRLSLEVERALGIDVSRLRGSTWTQAVLDTLVQVVLLIGLQVAAMLLNAVPLLGGLLALALSLTGTTTLIGLDLLALPLAARGVTRWQQLHYAWRNLRLCSGLGTSLLAWQAVPLLGSWGTTLALIGATELFHQAGDLTETPPSPKDSGQAED